MSTRSIGLAGCLVGALLLAGCGSSGSGTVSQSPTAVGQTVTDGILSPVIVLQGTDPQSDPLTYIILTLPAGGTLSDDGGPVGAGDTVVSAPDNDTVTYTHDGSYLGDDSFTFRVNDGTNDSTPGTVVINNVNTAPTATGQTVPDGTIDPDIILTGTDAEGQTLAYIILSLPAATLSDDGGAVGSVPHTVASAPNDDTVSYAHGSYTGVDYFTFMVNDGFTDSAVATVVINNSNSAPAATVPNPAATIDEDTVTPPVLDLSTWRTDTDNDSVTYTITALPSDGALSDENGAITVGALPYTIVSTPDNDTVTYTPDPDFPYAAKPNATDSFSFQMHDLLLPSAVYPVNIVVTNVNDEPVANDVIPLAIHMNPTAPVTIDLDGTDVDGDTPLVYVILTIPPVGEGTLADDVGDIDSGSLPYTVVAAPDNDAVTYTPPTDWTGETSYTYKVNDGTVDSLVDGTVTITVITQSAWAWGDNTLGQLGLGAGNYDQKDVPTQMSGFTVGQMADGGLYHSVILSLDETVKTVGGNLMGQLGVTGTVDTPVPVVPNGLPVSGSKLVAAGLEHTLVVSSTDGKVWAFGRNDFGQLGCSDWAHRDSAVEVTGLTDVIAVAAGGYHSMALKSDNSLWVWGGNSAYQLGLGPADNVDKNEPVQLVIPGVVVEAIAAGGDHSLALDSDGKVWSWGDNSLGQVGNGSAIGSEETPVEVLTTCTAIAAGMYHCLAVKTGSGIMAWGYNTEGQLGDGTMVSKSSPTLITGALSVDSLACGGFHSMALTTTGEVWAWGRNSEGQVGIGSVLLAITSPTEILTLSNVKSIGAGCYHSLAVKGD